MLKLEDFKKVEINSSQKVVGGADNTGPGEMCMHDGDCWRWDDDFMLFGKMHYYNGRVVDKDCE